MLYYLLHIWNTIRWWWRLMAGVKNERTKAKQSACCIYTDTAGTEAKFRKFSGSKNKLPYWRRITSGPTSVPNFGTRVLFLIIIISVFLEYVREHMMPARAWAVAYSVYVQMTYFRFFNTTFIILRFGLMCVMMVMMMMATIDSDINLSHTTYSPAMSEKI